MKAEEKEILNNYLAEIFNKINTAKVHLANRNYGLAEEVLCMPYPILDIKIDD